MDYRAGFGRRTEGMRGGKGAGMCVRSCVRRRKGRGIVGRRSGGETLFGKGWRMRIGLMWEECENIAESWRARRVSSSFAGNISFFIISIW